MAKLLPLHPRLGQLVIGKRPHTAPSIATHPSTERRTGGGSRQTWIHTDRVTFRPGRRMTLEQVEPLICSRLADIKSAFMAVDPDGTGLVNTEEFRQVLESLLCISQNQLDTVLNEVCVRSGETVDYMQFLRSFGRAPTAHRVCSSRSSVRRAPQNTSMSLSDIQKHLKEKIGGNLRTVIRVFRLFDYNREGHIQQHEFRRILDNYCIHLTDKEFQRLWNHYSPNSTSTISYQQFLEKLGFGESHNFKIAPVCTKLEVSSRGTTPPVKQRKQRPESVSSSCDAPSVLPHRKLQTLFYDKMCTNSTPVWQALQAFDTTHSGLVKQDVLRAVLSSFIFPMNPHSFQKLTSRYGVRAAGPVRWKHFLGHFMSPLKEEPDMNLQSDRALEKPLPDEDNLHIENIYPRLKEIFHLVDTTQDTPGVIQLASLEKINPSITSSPSPVNPAEPLDETEDTAEQEKTPDEKQTTECSDKVSVASASWRTVENLLLDKLCEQLSSVLAALKLCDPQQTGHVTQEDLKKVLSLYGMPISDTHFKKLCETSSSRPGSSSELVYYTGFLRNLGVPLTEETCSSHSERPCTSPLLTSQSVRTQRPPSCLQVSPDTCNILDIVFRRMRSKLEQRHASLTDRIQAIIHSSDDTLTETDVRKHLKSSTVARSDLLVYLLYLEYESGSALTWPAAQCSEAVCQTCPAFSSSAPQILEDSWVILDDKNFNEFTELLGFRDGRIERSAFLAKYEEATGRDGQQSSEGHGDKQEVDHLLISAEQCLAALKTRIKIIHGDNLTAFRWMDRKRRGVVDCHDFKRLYSSLGFLCREEEYQRLLDLISLHPGGNLNYAEFVDVVENNGKRKDGMQTANV
ncbi:hypothetical protein D5F01_LYC20556 [Larimichthys crocea]|uniref:EF-hand domain-containing protein n=1 Tax=Larimichthys crocea TaxID=215358 RepID=A0A6G0HQM8_LARCR|nr:hypothetical protein D5F01_LYC20556 [Larimichthys crocea]